jgi:hypothetical protein
VPASPISPTLSAFVDELDVLIRARYPLIYLVTWEEQRVDALLASLAESHGKALYTWSAVTMREDIARLREWARTRTRPASKPEPERPGKIGIV